MKTKSAKTSSKTGKRKYIKKSTTPAKPIAKVVIESDWKPRLKIGYQFPFDDMEIGQSFYTSKSQSWYKEIVPAVKEYNKSNPKRHLSIRLIYNHDKTVENSKTIIGKRVFRRA